MLVLTESILQGSARVSILSLLGEIIVKFKDFEPD